MAALARRCILRAAIAILAVAALLLAVSESPTAAASHASLTRCPMRHVAVSVGPYVSEATEQHTLALRLVSHEAAECTLSGYPRIVFSDAHGVMSFRFKDGGDQMLSARSPKPIAIKPGGTAYVLLNKNACVSGALRTATTLRIKFGRAGTASFAFPKVMPFRFRVPDYCVDAHDPGSVITVSPVVASVQAALNG